MKRINKNVSQTPPHRPRNIWIIILAVLIVTMCSCNQTPKVQQLSSAPTPILVVHVHDYSQSASIQYFDAQSATQLYTALSSFPGSSIRLWGVKSKGLQQDATTIKVAALDTIRLDTIRNVYLRAKALSINKKRLQQYQAQAKESLNRYISEITKPKSEEYSDVSGALTLAVMSLRTASVSSHSKILLLTSDLINNLPGKDKPLPTFQLPDVTVIAIRPGLSEEQLRAIFPDATIYIVADPQDIISIIQLFKN